MQIQTVFRAGNSNVVAIPKQLSKELGLKPGQKVFVEKDQASEAIVISKASKLKAKKSATSKEFKKWLKEALKEDAEILDELALR